LKRGFELDTRLGYTTTRFAELTEEEKGHILDKVESENTKKDYCNSGDSI